MSRSFIVIATATVAALAALALAMDGQYSHLYRPGKVLAGHERFADACQACHLPWSGPDPGKCVGCHANVMMFNSHSAKKLEAPLRVEVDDKYRKFTCVTCHREHKGADMPNLKYTGAPDICRDCHPLADLRSDHQNYEFSSCSRGDCHSYHVNITRADFDQTAKVRLLEKTIRPMAHRPPNRDPVKPETLESMKRSAFFQQNPAIAAKHAIGPHNGSQATCARCHEKDGGQLVEKPLITVCAECHPTQFYGFSSGLHGAARARGAARVNRPREDVGCGSCHDVHSLILSSAGREACKKCHDDLHTINFEKSGHYRYISDPVFAFKAVMGVDCAGCHMPKLDELNGHTLHNESYSISNRKIMASMVCARCHGMKFSLLSLFDPEVIKYNFTYVSAAPTPEGLAGHFKAGGVE
ncbi:MAG: cytochrome c3 family protein [Nitrospinota bacterium]|nr:cytochrome c3 family protein [Nitrospinota bacterium]